jgi:hypothetical protein
LEDHSGDGVVDGGGDSVVRGGGVKDQRMKETWRRLRDLNMRIGRWRREGLEDDCGDGVDWRTMTA